LYHSVFFFGKGEHGELLARRFLIPSRPGLVPALTGVRKSWAGQRAGSPTQHPSRLVLGDPPLSCADPPMRTSPARFLREAVAPACFFNFYDLPILDRREFLHLVEGSRSHAITVPPPDKLTQLCVTPSTNEGSCRSIQSLASLRRLPRSTRAVRTTYRDRRLANLQIPLVTACSPPPPFIPFTLFDFSDVVDLLA